MTNRLMAPGATMSLPMVLATATPKMNGPENSATAVTAMATGGRKARDETIVATMLLEFAITIEQAEQKRQADEERAAAAAMRRLRSS